MKLHLSSLNDLPSVAADFLTYTSGKKQFAFYGGMGVGKTTFIKAICAHMDVLEVVTSPTFAIVNEYHTRKGETVYHFDLYRIKKLEELYDLGYEDYLYSNNYCFVEWPEMGEDVLPDHMVKIQMTETPEGGRVIEIS